MPTARSFSFVTKSFIDQNLDKETARQRDARAAGRQDPDRQARDSKSFELQPTQFPTQHLVDLINRAKTGETFYETSIFDGSEDADKAMTTTVIVGKQAEAEQQRSGS